MPKIKVLEPAIANKIAAGEVVERPSSVVKELIENCIDAGASRIDVEIEEGGKKLIRITDDGIGMEADDLPLAFASHATSKLLQPEDLFSIGTMGFRGEALASIGSVSQAKIVSRQRSGDAGSELECRGGEIGQVKACGASEGTAIEVRNLFYNVPVRRKFLKSTASETASISDILTRMALAFPGVHFLFSSNGKEVFNSPPSSRQERITTFYGKDLSDDLLEISCETPELTIQGFVTLPANNRANRSWQLLFLNGRSIQDRSLSHAMNEAYRGLMPERRFPIMFLFLEMDPSEVDVNAHPTKIEVRFRSGWSLYGRLLNVIRQRLLSEERVAALNIDQNQPLFERTGTAGAGGGEIAPGDPHSGPLQEGERGRSGPSQQDRPQEGVGTQSGAGSISGSEEMLGHIDSHSQPADAFSLKSSPAQRALGFRVPPATLQEHDATPVPTATSPIVPPSPPSVDFSKLEGRPFMQLHDSYIVVETEDGFIVVDQHALHERILYSELYEKLQRERLESQQLLLPEPVDLTPKEIALIRELKPALQDLGLEIEEFGRGGAVIQAVPAFLKSASAGRLLHDILSEMAEGESARSLENIRERILATMACKAAIKFGDPLQPGEIEALLRKSKDVPESIACPHGRPTRLSVELKDLDRQFGRT